MVEVSVTLTIPEAEALLELAEAAAPGPDAARMILGASWREAASVRARSKLATAISVAQVRAAAKGAKR